MNGNRLDATRVNPEQVAQQPPSELPQIRNSALAMLSRREFCRAQLGQRLLRKYSCRGQVEEVLDWLEGLSYLDDQRYAAMFLRTALGKYRGPNRIRLEMKQQGLATPIIDNALAENTVDWGEQALACLQRRFAEPCEDMKQKAKHYRYLQAQGFGAEHIHYALDQHRDLART
ncbi:MAG: recombination regulator RecX [Cellvibrionaceae bacterium]|nr:recombination regulator RecX [Cellvibrionaceae bacterium]